MKRLGALLLCLLLLMGCGTEVDMKEGETLQMGQVTAMPKASPVPPDGGMGEGADAFAAQPQAQQTEGVTPTLVPTPAPTPTPLFVLKAEGGTDLIINEDLYASFTERTFPLPSVTARKTWV